MRKTILICLALFTVALTGEAQDLLRHVISFNFGFGANIADHRVRNTVNKYQMEEDIEPEDLAGDRHGVLNLEYHYCLNKHWAIGGMMGWGRSRESYIGFDETSKPEGASKWYESRGNETSKIFYVAPSVKYTWLNWRDDWAHTYSFYSRCAVGVMRQHVTFDFSEGTVWNDAKTGHYQSDIKKNPDKCTDETKWKPTLQLTPIGFEIRKRHFGYFAEVGYGCQGVVAIGLRYAFGH